MMKKRVITLALGAIIIASAFALFFMQFISMDVMVASLTAVALPLSIVRSYQKWLAKIETASKNPASAETAGYRVIVKKRAGANRKKLFIGKNREILEKIGLIAS